MEDFATVELEDEDDEEDDEEEVEEESDSDPLSSAVSGALSSGSWLSWLSLAADSDNFLGPFFIGVFITVIRLE